MRLPRFFRSIPKISFGRRAKNEAPQSSSGPQRRWDAAGTNRINESHWAGANLTDTPISNDQATNLDRIRVRSQYEIANNAMLAGVVETWVSDMLQKVGPHLRVKSDIDNQFAQDLMEIWQAWWEAPDLRGRRSGVDMLRTAFRGYFPAGEYIFQIVTDDQSTLRIKGKLFKTKIVGIAPRRLKHPYGAVGSAGQNIALGIESDSFGRPIRYFFEDERSFGAYAFGSGEMVPVPARDIIHDFVALEPDQIRGVPWLAFNLGTIGELRDFDQQVLDAARLVASQTLFIYSDHALIEPVNIDPGEQVEIDRNTMTVLPPGYKPFSLPATQPSNNYKEFRHERMRELGRFVGMPLLHIMLDSRDHNFATARLDRGMYRSQLISHQDRIEFSTLDRLMWAVYREARLLNVIGDMPDDFIHEWIWPSLPEGDAKTSAQATTESLNNRTMSRTEAINMRGRDPEDVFREIAEENAMMETYGITEMPTPAPQPQPEGTDDDEQAND